MFSNPNTLWIEILVIALVVAFLAFIIARHIYKKVHHLPTGECECCHPHSNNIVKEYHKKYSKK